MSFDSVFAKYKDDIGKSLNLVKYNGNKLFYLKYNDEIFGNMSRLLVFNNSKDVDNILNKYKWYLDNKNSKKLKIKFDDYRNIFSNYYIYLDDRLYLNDDKEDVVNSLIEYYYIIKFREENIVDQYNMLVKVYNDKVEKLKKIHNREKYELLEEVSCIHIEDNGINNKKISNIINMCYGIELNGNYYDYKVKCNKLIDSIRIIDLKLEYYKNKSLKKKTINIKDINNMYNNKEYESLEKYKEKIVNKYKYVTKLKNKDIVLYFEYSFLDSNYELIYNKIINNIDNKSKNEIAIYLKKEYDKYSEEEKQLATLYNTEYKDIFDYILDSSNKHNYNLKKLVRYLDSIEHISKLKEDCMENVSYKIKDECNKDIYNKFFHNISFKDFTTYVYDLVNILTNINSIKNKIKLNSDLVLYFDDSKDINSRVLVYMDDDNTLVEDLKERNGILGIGHIYKDVDIIHSPYDLIFGNIYDESNKIYLNRSINMKLVIDIKEVDYFCDKGYNECVYYDIINNNKEIEDIDFKNILKYRNYIFIKKG